MLNKLTLKNFRKHTELALDLGAGLVVLRGNNELGKSTAFEAIAYALYGVKALRSSLEDAVTWGEAVSTLKVELELSIDGVDYSIKRSKSGAQIDYAGGTVTGQNEVSAFASKLLKADCPMAQRLMLAGQVEIRGALEAGAKATTELIEKLAEFDQIDGLIELMQEKLMLGNSAGLEVALAQAQSQLDEARELAVPVDTGGLQARIDAARVSLDEVEARSATAQQQLDKVQDQHAVAREQASRRGALLRDLGKASENLGALDEKLEGLKAVKAPVGAEVEVERLALEVAGAEKWAEVSTVYKLVEPFARRDESAKTYRGSVEQLKAELEAGVTKESPTNADVVRLDGEVRLLKQSLTHGSCTFCGKDFSGVPEVAEKNAGIQESLDSAVKAMEVSRAALVALAAANEKLRNIEMASRPALRALASAGAYAELGDGLLPPVLKWIGPVVGEAPADVPALKRRIDSIHLAQRAFQSAQARLSDTQEQVVACRKAYEELNEALAKAVVGDLSQSQAALDEARKACTICASECRAADGELRDSERALKDAHEAYARAVSQRDKAQACLAGRSADLATLNFNNALLKRVRQARPLLADRLWSLVLGAVGTYFSEMRGVKSRVTKEGDGFRVDGHPIATLSGSTLDILGLALRVVLVRTFIPTAPFLLLDEPFHGCDDGRAAGALGFLSRLGMGQILLVTHEDASESVADSLITL